MPSRFKPKFESKKLNKKIKFAKQVDDYSCAPIACYNLNKFFQTGRYKSLKKLREMCKCRPDGTNFDEMILAVNYIQENTNIKLIGTVIQPTIKDIQYFFKMYSHGAIILEYSFSIGKYHSSLLFPKDDNGCYMISTFNATGSKLKHYYNYSYLEKLLKIKVDNGMDSCPFIWNFIGD
jgi:hypothetical protein